MPCETQHAYMCHNLQRQLRHVSLIKHHHYRLKHLNETSQKA